MDIYEALYTTRAMRRMRPDPIPIEVQERIVDAAIRAPSGGNQQNWRFMLVDDPAIIAQMAPIYKAGWDELVRSGYLDQSGADPGAARVAGSAGHMAEHFAEIPLLLFGFGKGNPGSSVYPALWSAQLAARAEGVGTTLTTILGTEHDRVLEILGVPKEEGWKMAGCLTMGYPTGRWGVAARRPAHEVTFRNRWNTRPGFETPEPLWPRRESQG